MTTTTVQKPMTHSHSRLQVFSSCPLAYKLQYVDKMPTEDSDAMEIGAAAHEFFDQWVKQWQDPMKVQDEIDFTLLASKCFQKESRNQSNFKDYLEICKTFAKEYKPDPKYPIVMAERQVAFDRKWKECSWMSPDVMFRAKIDRIEAPAEGVEVKKIRVTDYKTGFAGSMDSFQLDVYALVASLIYPGLEQVEIQFYYTRSGFKQVKLLEVKDLDITKVQLEALMERIEGESKWKAKPGQRCLNCSVAAHCTQKPSGLKAISSPDDAKSLALEISFLEAQAKAKKKPLNAYCKENGPVEAGGLVYNHYPIESLNVQTIDILRVCIEQGIDPGEIFNPDSTKFKKLCKKKPDFGAAVAPYVAIDVSTRFYSKKDEEEK